MTKRSKWDYSKVVRDICTKFSPVVTLMENPLCTKFEVSRCQKIWISCQKPLNLPVGVAGLFFEPRPPNLVRIHFEVSCKNAEILIMISWVVTKLAKISLSVLSISRDVLALVHLLQSIQPSDWLKNCCCSLADPKECKESQLEAVVACI